MRKCLNAASTPRGPGTLAQLERVTAGIYLRSEYDPNLILGRPTVCAALDSWAWSFYSCTAMFEQESFWGGAMALENALVHKVEYCAEYGITIGPDEWPVECLPDALQVDRDEMSSYKCDHLVTGLGIRISPLPSRRGDLKGILERQFRLLNLNSIRWLNGALPRFRDKNDNRPCELDGKFTIREFQRLLISAVLNHQRSLLPDYKLEADMVAAGIQPRPIELLRWGRDHRTGLFRTFDLQQARFQLLPHSEAKITDQGIRFGRLYYTCERAMREKWYERARHFGVRSLEIAFDPRRIDKIWFEAGDNTMIEEAALAPSYACFSGWTWEEVADYFKAQRKFKLEKHLNPNLFKIKHT